MTDKETDIIEDDEKEPSMEDILSSIKKILSEEETEAEPVAEQKPEPIEEPVIESEPVAEQKPEPIEEPEPVAEPKPVIESEPEIMELTEDMVSKEPIPIEPLVSQNTADTAACAFATLSQSIAEERNTALGNANLTIEEIVRQTVKPIVQDWLDIHLSEIVERMVKREIARVSERADIFSDEQ
ncbi:MAG: DUF2497 domain-containing protein [Alphaproteobacteria bacterium]|nr:DUF2497 domain-containing protein [Alphaproteobacteria bacterium]